MSWIDNVGGKWTVHVRIQDGVENCGTYDTMEDALQAWIYSEKALNFRSDKWLVDFSPKVAGYRVAVSSKTGSLYIVSPDSRRTKKQRQAKQNTARKRQTKKGPGSQKGKKKCEDMWDLI